VFCVRICRQTDKQTDMQMDSTALVCEAAFAIASGILFIVHNHIMYRF